MRFLLTLLVLIAGFATPGMTFAAARAQVSGAERVEVAGIVVPAVAAINTASPPPRAIAATVRDEPAPVVACADLADCSIALSDRPRE